MFTGSLPIRSPPATAAAHVDRASAVPGPGGAGRSRAAAGELISHRAADRHPASFPQPSRRPSSTSWSNVDISAIIALRQLIFGQLHLWRLQAWSALIEMKMRIGNNRMQLTISIRIQRCWAHELNRLEPVQLRTVRVRLAARMTRRPRGTERVVPETPARSAAGSNSSPRCWTPHIHCKGIGQQIRFGRKFHLRGAGPRHKR